MKTILSILIAATVCASAQTNKPTSIKGAMDIAYNTRGGSGPQVGQFDAYTLRVNMSDSVVFRGTISHWPYIPGLVTANQQSKIEYAIDCDVMNPANPSQVRENVGRIYGRVPINEQGVYSYTDGTLKIGVVVGKEFESKFTGTAAGKPLAKAGLLDRAKKEALNVTRSVQGKPVAIAIKKYDKMAFRDHVLAMGPVPIYTPVTVNGEMVYDYDRAAWFFNNVTLSYQDGSSQRIDRLTGNIRWLKSSTGDGRYEFDVRVNEPPAGEASLFAGASDESAFFAVDTSIAALTGNMSYKDTVSGSTVTASKVAFDLIGNSLSRQQTMNLCKLLVFSSIVPMNAE